MRTIQCVRVRWLTVALGACLILGGAARADISTERPGSILIFPKVVNDGTRDTVIQITNTGNLTDQARCFYLNGQAGRDGRPLCSETDFTIFLTKQQPTQWRVSAGRAVDSTDPLGSSGAGLDPGLIPPVPVGFTGALICAEVDSNDTPVGMNQLKGEATLQGPGADESKYNGLAIQGNSVGGGNNGDNVLDLNGSEYNLCPASVLLNLIPNGATDPVIETSGNGGFCVGGTNAGAPCNNGGECDSLICSSGGSEVLNRLALLPCNLDFQNGIATSVSVSFTVYDEFEGQFSGSTVFSCWADIDLGTIPALTSGSIKTQYATARISSTVGGPIVGVAESFHTDTAGNTAGVAVNLHMEGTCSATSSNAGAHCSNHADCPGGGCLGLPAAIVLSDN